MPYRSPWSESSLVQLLKAALSPKPQPLEDWEVELQDMSPIDKMRVITGEKDSPLKDHIKDEYYGNLTNSFDGGGGMPHVPFTPGEIKSVVPFNRYKQIMAGQNPLDLSLKELGQYIQKLGPSMRNKLGELMGAQAIDQYGTEDAKQLLEAHMKDRGIPEAQIPSLNINGPGPYHEGSFNPINNKIELVTPDSSVLSKLGDPQHPDEYNLGTLKHEAWHAGQYLQNPDISSNPEIFLPNSKTNKNLAWNGFFQPSKMADFISYSKDHPEESLVSPWIEMLLDKGHSPADLARILQSSKSFQSEMGQEVRQAVGNNGFRGTNPYLADILQSGGHFGEARAPDFVKGEMEIPLLELGRQQAAAGGDIHPDILNRFPELKARQEAYQSPIRPGQNYSGDVPQQTAAMNPWNFVGPALAGGAGYGVTNYLVNDDSSSKPDPNAYQNNYPGLKPTPQHNGFLPLGNDDDTEFWDTVKRLRNAAPLHTLSPDTSP